MSWIFAYLKDKYFYPSEIFIGKKGKTKGDWTGQKQSYESIFHSRSRCLRYPFIDHSLIAIKTKSSLRFVTKLDRLTCNKIARDTLRS